MRKLFPDPVNVTLEALAVNTPPEFNHSPPTATPLLVAPDLLFKVPASRFIVLITVIESCITNLREAEVNDVVVVVGYRGSDIQELLYRAEVQFATNPDPDSEMSDSIACGVREVIQSARAVLITPADHPAVDAETISAVIEQWKLGAPLVQPEYLGRGGHPIVIDAAYREDLLHLDRSRGLRGFLIAHAADVTRLAVQSPYIARDIDTWVDYLALHQEIFGRGPRRI